MSEIEDQDQTPGGLRKQLEQVLAENQALKTQLDQGQGAQRELAFMKAGVDTTSGPGKLLAKAYDGDLDPEAIKTYATEYGIEVGAATTTAGEEPAGRAQPDPTQQRMDSLRASSKPEGVGQKMPHTDWLKLNQSDASAARAAWDAGQVDVPPHIASALNANGRAVPAT